MTRTFFRLMLRHSDQYGIDLLDPDMREFPTKDEAVAALAALPLSTSPYREWVAVQYDVSGGSWERRVVAEHRDVVRES